MFFLGSVIPSYDVHIDGSGQATYTPKEDHRMAGHREQWQQRDPANSPPTQKQIAFLQKLMLSSEFTDKEVEDAEDWMYSDRATEAAMSQLIDKAKRRLEARKGRQAASERRKQQFHSAKAEKGVV